MTMNQSWYQYVITYSRTVNGFPDESGPSPVSAGIFTSGPTTVARDPNDGGNFVIAYSSSGGPGCSVAASTPAFYITGVMVDNALGMAVLTFDSTLAAHGLIAGQSVAIAGSTAPIGVSQTTSLNPTANLISINTPTTNLIAALAVPTLVAGSTKLGLGLPVASPGQGIAFTAGETVQYAVTAIKGDIYLTHGLPAETTAVVSSAMTPASGYAYTPYVTWQAVPGANWYAVYIRCSTSTGNAWRLVDYVPASLNSYQHTIQRGIPGASARSIPLTNTTGSYTLAVPLNLVNVARVGVNDVVYRKILGLSTYYYGALYTSLNVTINWTGTLPAVGKVVRFTGPLATSFPGFYTVQSVGSGNFVISNACAPKAVPTSSLDGMDVGAMDWGNITGWNLYRASDGINFSLVAGNLPIAQTSYTDTTASSDLGRLLPTAYTDESGTFVQFAPPPTNLRQITSHAQMLWGLSGNMLRWTPVNRPDAWPLVYSMVLPSVPVALRSYNGALFVLTMAGLHRIDVINPGNVSISTSLSEDGCIAPYSVACTSKAMVYLSQKGLIGFIPSTYQTVLLVGFKLLARFFFMPSSGSAAFPHWWIPSRKTFAYNALTQGLGNESLASMIAGFTPLVSFANPIMTIKGFAVDDKYHLH